MLSLAYDTGGGGNDTPSLRVLPPEFLKSYPVSEWNFQIYTLPQSLAFFQGFFRGGGKIYCNANFFCYANFSIIFKPFFWGGGQIAWGKASSQPNNVSKHRNELFLKEILKDVSFFLCVGGCNFPAELVSKNFRPLQNTPKKLSHPRRWGILSRVFDKIFSDRRSLLSIAEAWGRCKPPTG